MPSLMPSTELLSFSMPSLELVQGILFGKVTINFLVLSMLIM